MIYPKRDDQPARLSSHDVAALPVPPQWVDQALCAEVEAELFFPVKGGRNHGSVAEAKSVCRRCSVTLDCLEWALANDDQWGIYGGMSPRERTRLKKQRRAS